MVRFTPDDYSLFLQILGILRGKSQDVFIRGGKILQMSSKKNMVFDIDMRKILQDLDLTINNLAEKIELYRILQKEEVVLSTDDTNFYSLTDGRTKISIRCPVEKYLESVKLTEETLAERINFDSNYLSSEVIFDKKMMERLNSLASVLTILNITFEFKSGTLTFRLESISKTSLTDITLNTVSVEYDPSLENAKLVAPVDAFECMNKSGVETFSIQIHGTNNKMTDKKGYVAALTSSIKSTISSTENLVDLKIYALMMEKDQYMIQKQ